MNQVHVINCPRSPLPSHAADGSAEDLIADPQRFLVDAAWLAATGAEGVCRVVGASMAKFGVGDGDYVGFKHQDTAEDGDIVIADTPEGRCLLAYVHLDGREYLMSAELNERVITLSDAIKIVGVVVGVIHFKEEKR